MGVAFSSLWSSLFGREELKSAPSLLACCSSLRSILTEYHLICLRLLSMHPRVSKAASMLC